MLIEINDRFPRHYAQSSTYVFIYRNYQGSDSYGKIHEIAKGLRQLQSDIKMNNVSYLIIQVTKTMLPTTKQFNKKYLEALKNIRLQLVQHHFFQISFQIKSKAHIQRHLKVSSHHAIMHHLHIDGSTPQLQSSTEMRSRKTNQD